MNYTIFDTPVLNIFLRWFSLIALKITGWRTHGRLPATPKFVLLGAPHTSNWDLPYMIFIIFSLRGKIYWMGKESLFRQPYKGFFKWLGGLPIDRSRSTNVVAQSIQRFNQNKTIILAIAPEGTRSRVKKWKTGFYHIAKGANVPIVLGFLDYRRKAGGIGPLIYPTGNIEADMKAIQSFYGNVYAKYPDKSISSANEKQ